jgi:peptide/nickel transport system substrate-binding protein
LGVEVEVQTLPQEDISPMIQNNKSYDMILFGQNLGGNRDLYPFWHSSQIATGFNLSLFDNREVDYLLEEVRLSTDSRKRKESREQAVALIKKEQPALFLFTPLYLHLIPADIKGVSDQAGGVVPEDRLTGIESWYLKEKKER